MFFKGNSLMLTFEKKSSLFLGAYYLTASEGLCWTLALGSYCSVGYKLEQYKKSQKAWHILCAVMDFFLTFPPPLVLFWSPSPLFPLWLPLSRKPSVSRPGRASQSEMSQSRRQE